jgi:hypothetical protein
LRQLRKKDIQGELLSGRGSRQGDGRKAVSRLHSELLRSRDLPDARNQAPGMTARAAPAVQMADAVAVNLSSRIKLFNPDSPSYSEFQKKI